MKLLIIFAAFAVFSSGSFAMERDLLTVIQYNGGFKADVTGDVASKEMIAEFRISIPAFCQGVEVLEAATFSEGVKDVATLKDSSKHIYSVRNGNAMRISKISLTLNGPANATCAIPVFLNTNDGGIHTGTLIANDHLTLCTNGLRPVNVAIAQEVNNRWRVTGWHYIPGRSCIVPMTKGLLQGRIYTHGVRSGLITTMWGTERPFCVRPTATFELWNDECDNYAGASNPKFSGHDIDVHANTTLRFN